MTQLMQLSAEELLKRVLKIPGGRYCNVKLDQVSKNKQQYAALVKYWEDKE